MRVEGSGHALQSTRPLLCNVCTTPCLETFECPAYILQCTSTRCGLAHTKQVRLREKGVSKNGHGLYRLSWFRHGCSGECTSFTRPTASMLKSFCTCKNRKKCACSVLAAVRQNKRNITRRDQKPARRHIFEQHCHLKEVSKCRGSENTAFIRIRQNAGKRAWLFARRCAQTPSENCMLRRKYVETAVRVAASLQPRLGSGFGFQNRRSRL